MNLYGTKLRWLVIFALGACALPGCKLVEIRSKSKAGPEYIHRGSDSTNNTRWTVEQGLDFKWQNGVTTGVTYRRRDVDDGNGDNENRVLLEFAFPLWKAESAEAKLARRVERLERRLAELQPAVAPGGESW
jgi:hypothetical protein